MISTDCKQSQDLAYYPSSSSHSRHHRLHCRHQYQQEHDHDQHHHQEQRQQQQQQQHCRLVSLLLLSSSPTTILTLLIFSSAWTLPLCCALSPMTPGGASRPDTSSNSRTGSSSVYGTHSKRTILPFHFKLLQDYLHHHGIGSSGTGLGSNVRYPVEMLLPPGVRIAADTRSHGSWWRSRRSIPLNDIAHSLGSKSFPGINVDQVVESSKRLPSGLFSFSYEVPKLEDVEYPDPAGIALEKSFDYQPKSSKFKYKSFETDPKKTPKGRTRHYSDRIRQRQAIIEALRRRDRAKVAAAAEKNSDSSDQLLPILANAGTEAFQELRALKKHKAFLRKHKSKNRESLVQAAEILDNRRRDQQGSFLVDPLIPILNQELKSLKKAAGRHEEFFTEMDSLESSSDLEDVGWFGPTEFTEDRSPLLSVPAVGGRFPSIPMEVHDTLVFNDGEFGEGQGFSRFDGFSSSPGARPDGFVSASGSLSHTGTFGEPLASFPSGASAMTSSFGSGNDDGFGDLWTEGEFVSDDVSIKAFLCGFLSSYFTSEICNENVKMIHLIFTYYLELFT